MADPARYLVRQPLGVPPITIFPATYPDDPVTRTIIRDSKLLAADFLPVGTTEQELARGLVLARELSSAGRIQLEVKGKLNVAAGDSGNVLLKLYASSSADPNVAKASMTLVATHTLAVADPGAHAQSDGNFRWSLEWSPNGTPDASNSQGLWSSVRYQRLLAEAMITDDYMTRTATDLRSADTTLLLTVTKPAGFGGSTVLDIYSVDGYVLNGQSGQA